MSGPGAVHDRLRVAVDATPLLAPLTGVGEFCVGAFEAMGTDPSLELRAFAVSWPRRRRLAPVLPAGIAAVERPMPARPLHAAWRRAPYPPIEWFVPGVDVVHGTNFVVPPSRRAVQVVTVHDIGFIRFPELSIPAAGVFGPLVRKAVARGAWVHTPSRFVADEVVEEFGVEPSRVRAIAHGIPAHTLDRLRRAAGARADAPPVSLPAGTGRYIVAVGTIEPRKDLPTLVRAFDRLAGARPDVALVIAGGEGWGVEPLDEAVHRSSFASRIVRTGYVPDDVLARLLAGAAVLAFPSLYEGFGLPPLEAMAAGVPVVATAAGAVPEVVGDGAVVVPVADPDALADGLASVLDDDDRRAALVAAGSRRAAQFSWESCAAGLAALYRAASGRV
ncbi:MAG TPA: glycosyltransferase family 1 protein [Acidimicrobiales bacterium]|nr:glycosyltransferase family 1 protein [Acidimicrobiales bacterium]